MNDTPNPAAPYRVLARKYRPSTFADLIGQDAMVRTVSNAFETGRIPQAWILTGVRGVGKTTTARILARAMNCPTARSPGRRSTCRCWACTASRSWKAGIST
jgi:DNA polymerase-3 subunit gamma/tau